MLLLSLSGALSGCFYISNQENGQAFGGNKFWDPPTDPGDI